MNAKIYNGNIQPNHKEYKIWVNDEGIIKTWNGTKWVEQSGTSDDNGSGSGTGGEGDSNIEYLDVSGVSPGLRAALVQNCIYLKGFIEQYGMYVTGTTYYSYNAIKGDVDDISQIAIALKDGIIISTGSAISSQTFEENVKQNVGVTQEQLDTIPRITKEEFYNLEA